MSAYDTLALSLGAIAHYEYQDGPGSSTAADSSGHGNTATANGPMTFGGGGGPVGMPPEALALPGGDASWLGIGSPSGIAAQPGALTVIAWWNVTDDGSYQGPFRWADDTTGATVNMWMDVPDYGSNSLRFEIADASGNDEQFWASSHSVCDGSWHMCAITFNAGSGNFWLDGSVVTGYGGLVSTLAFAGTIDLFMGAFAANLWSLNGNLGPVSIFPTALTPTQLAQLWAKGNSVIVNGTGASTDTLTTAATGTVKVSGTGSSLDTLTGSAAGAVKVAGTGAQGLSLSANSTGAVSIAGSASSASTLTGAASGAVSVAGAGAQSLSLGTTAVGSVRMAGSGAQTLTLSATAVGIFAITGGHGATTSTLTAVAAGGWSVERDIAIQLSAPYSAWEFGPPLGSELQAGPPYSIWETRLRT